MFGERRLEEAKRPPHNILLLEWMMPRVEGGFILVAVWGGARWRFGRGPTGSLPNLPRGFPLSNHMDASPFDTCHHWYIVRSASYPDNGSPSPGHSSSGRYGIRYISSGMCFQPPIQLPWIYPIRNMLLTNRKTMSTRNWGSNSNGALDQVSHKSLCFVNSRRVW